MIAKHELPGAPGNESSRPRGHRLTHVDLSRQYPDQLGEVQDAAGSWWAVSARHSRKRTKSYLNAWVDVLAERSPMKEGQRNRFRLSWSWAECRFARNTDLRDLTRVDSKLFLAIRKLCAKNLSPF